MADALAPLVLAVDGGGTRCRIAASDGTRTLSVEVGPANVSTDFDAAVRQILSGVERLAELTGRPVDDLFAAPSFVGLAGVTGPVIANRLQAALPFRHARVADDRVGAVRGALGARDGLVAHCGTGSFYAAQRGGSARFAGGWGHALGDEASAQWVGRMALGLTLKSADGRMDRSPLAARLLADFGDTVGIVAFAGAARPSEFGAIAPLVTEFAAAGDAMAEQIMRQGAQDIVAALRALGGKGGETLCLTGGIGPHFAGYLTEDFRRGLSAPAGEPLDGALSLARDFAQEITRERG